MKAVTEAVRFILPYGFSGLTQVKQGEQGIVCAWYYIRNGKFYPRASLEEIAEAIKTATPQIERGNIVSDENLIDFQETEGDHISGTITWRKYKPNVNIFR